jgi:hypothetical protein
MSDRFVNAYDKDTGVKHRIPAHWLTHPTLSRPWRKTPKQRATDGTNTDPSAGSATPGTDVALTAPPASTTPPSTTETPAAGAKE